MILDKWGTKPVYTIAAVFCMLGFYLTAKVESLYSYYAAYAIFAGIGTGMLWVSSTNYSVLLMKLKSNWLLQGVHIMPVSLIIIMQCRPFHLTYWLVSLGLTVKGYGLFRNRNVLLLM